MDAQEFTVRARELLGMDDVELVDLDAGGRRIARVSGMGEGDVWLQYHDHDEPRSVPAWGEVRVRPSEGPGGQGPGEQ